MASGQRYYRSLVEFLVGHKLPPKVEIHHIDENPKNNARSNLVVCPDRAYHRLLHVRTAAFKACGNYAYRKCPFCQEYDDPKNMLRVGASSGREAYRHRSCNNEAFKRWYYRGRNAIE